MEPDAAPVEAETLDGRWKLLTAHPRPDGGMALVSVDITEMKRAQIAHQENAEIFRCITDSHPLPVWVVDAGSGQILYESLDASNLLGRKWTPNEPQFLTDHFVNSGEFDEISSLASNSEIVRDHEIQLRNTSGSAVWCSTNCRRGVYGGRPSLIIGVLDITERKQREDLFGFLIKHHPLPVWMNDASSGELIYQSDAAERLLGWSKESATRDGAARPTTLSTPRNTGKSIGSSCKRASSKIARRCLKDPTARSSGPPGNLRIVEFQGRQVVLAGIADVTKQKKRDGEVARRGRCSQTPLNHSPKDSRCTTKITAWSCATAFTAK